jgi:hypothetical protein
MGVCDGPQNSLKYQRPNIKRSLKIASLTLLISAALLGETGTIVTEEAEHVKREAVPFAKLTGWAGAEHHAATVRGRSNMFQD